MLLKCDVVVVNRLAPNIESKKCHTTISLGKGKSNDNADSNSVYFVLHTLKNKSGTKYVVNGNIIRVHNRFMNEGKCTLSMAEPVHNLVLSKANPTELKKFILVIKLALKGEDTSLAALDFQNTQRLKTIDLEKPKTSLNIQKKSDYPVKSTFPPSLEQLTINHCFLKAFDHRILKLVNLVKLDLRHNNLTHLCESFDNLQNLSCVYLSNNQFEEVPGCLYSNCMQFQLKWLDVSNNKISFLPNQLVQLTELVTLNLNNNKITFLPGNFGLLKTLQYLHIAGNAISLIPWSFTHLTRLQRLEFDVSLIHDSSERFPLTNSSSLEDVQSLFESAARCLVNHRTFIVQDVIPCKIKDQLDNVKYCPCGSPCIRRYIPYVKAFDLSHISQELLTNQVFPGQKMFANMIGYLCSAKCHKKLKDNPQTLFTSKNF